MDPYADGSPRGPLTYVISYREGNTVDDAWADRLAQAPPDLAHHGHDVPLNNLWGPTQGLSAWEPDHAGSPADVHGKIDLLRRGIDRLHERGVRYVIPYMNPSIIGGDPDTPGAFFHFWRRKAEFAEFGIDRLPADDPLDWMQRNAFSFAQYNPKCPYLRYEPCLRREAWLGYVETVAGLIAQAGYDGLFSDDDNVQCHCPRCMEDFRAFLRAEYANRVAELERTVPIDRTMLYSDDGRGTGPAMRRPTSGLPSVGPPLRDGFPVDPWATLVWEASQAFWSQTVADMLVRLRDAGRRHNPRFFVVANWGMSRSAESLGLRRRLGHNVARWRKGATWQMLEEDGSVGYIAPGLVAELWTSCRAVAAQGAEPALLAYTRPDAMQKALGFAEIASAGCGAFVDGGGSTELTTKYRAFYADRAELFAGAEPYAPIGLYYSFDEITRNNDDHLRLFYAASRALGRSHLPYDVVTRDQLASRRFAAIVNPGSRDLPAAYRDRIPIIAIGPGGEPAEEILSPTEVALDRLLDHSWKEQESRVAEWANVDLRGPAPIAAKIRALAGRNLAIATDPAAHAVRIRAFVIPADRRVVVHVVNYGCTAMAETIVPPGVAARFPLFVPAIDGWEPAGAWTEGPDVGRETLAIAPKRTRPTVIVPPTEVYRVIVIQYR